MKKQGIIIILITIFACLCMGIVDAVIQPGYFIKSVFKLVLFLGLPLIYTCFNKDFDIKSLFKLHKNGLFTALGMGIILYGVVLGAFFLFRNIFDFSKLTTSLTSSTGVNKNNFIFVAIYISFINSFLEEFFFRGFAFLKLKNQIPKKWAYSISALLFALYHIAMMIGWFDFLVVLLAIIGLFIGGIIFNFFNEKYNNIYLSWIIHMFTNFATNTIGFILFNA